MRPSIIKRVQTVLEAAEEPGYKSLRLPAYAWLVAAVSGGPDSLALLHMLSQHQLHRSDRILVAHLNHGLREKADADALFVSQLAGGWNLPIVTIKEDVAALARDQGMTMEEAGRAARYRFLAEVAKQRGAAAVLTGHTAQDQAETVLMHLLRGTGIKGLSGMRPLSTVPGMADLLLIRPLLDVDRDEILTYCQQHDLRPVIDESNKDTRFERNWVRHKLLPMMEGQHPGVARRLIQLAEVAVGDMEFLEAQTEMAAAHILEDSDEDSTYYDLDKWRKLSLSLKRSTIRLAIQHLSHDTSDLGYRALEAARELGERGTIEQSLHLPGGIRMHIGYAALSFRRSGHPISLPALPQMPDVECIALRFPGAVHLEGGWTLETSVIEDLDYDSIINNRDPWQAYLAGDWLDQWVVRRAQPGERFRPLGMAGHSAKVQDVLVNRKVLLDLRQKWPVIANKEHILWLVGQQIDERAKVLGTTKKVIRVRVVKDKMV